MVHIMPMLFFGYRKKCAENAKIKITLKQIISCIWSILMIEAAITAAII